MSVRRYKPVAKIRNAPHGYRPLETEACGWHLRGVTTEEAKRHDLYNAAIEVFGEINAETLMALLPAHEGIDLATRDDLIGVSDHLSGRMDRLEDRFDRLDERIDAVNQRLDRLFLTLTAGLIAMVAAVFAQAFL
jgi:hypothetical protein